MKRMSFLATRVFLRIFQGIYLIRKFVLNLSLTWHTEVERADGREVRLSAMVCN